MPELGERLSTHVLDEYIAIEDRRMRYIIFRARRCSQVAEAEDSGWMPSRDGDDHLLLSSRGELCLDWMNMSLVPVPPLYRLQQWDRGLLEAQ